MDSWAPKVYISAKYSWWGRQTGRCPAIHSLQKTVNWILSYMINLHHAIQIKFTYQLLSLNVYKTIPKRYISEKWKFICRCKWLIVNTPASQSGQFSQDFLNPPDLLLMLELRGWIVCPYMHPCFQPQRQPFSQWTASRVNGLQGSSLIISC